MNRTRPATLVTSGQPVEGLRAKYYDIGNTPLGLPFAIRPHVRLVTLEAVALFFIFQDVSGLTI